MSECPMAKKNPSDYLLSLSLENEIFMSLSADGAQVSIAYFLRSRQEAHLFWFLKATTPWCNESFTTVPFGCSVLRALQIS